MTRAYLVDVIVVHSWTAETLKWRGSVGYVPSVTLQRISVISLAVSYNRPRFCANASWSIDAVTIADQSMIGRGSHSIFINSDDLLFISEFDENSFQVWFTNSTIFRGRIAVGRNPHSLFALADEVFVDGGDENRVRRWSLGINGTTVMKINGACYGLFMDIAQTLYCCIRNEHRVVSKKLDNDPDNVTTIAGTGSCQQYSHALCHPRGIFVAINFTLYVADHDNNRIQRFKCGETNGTTVAGREAVGTIELKSPTAIVLDADGYLFIVDSGNHRVIRSGPNGFRCVAGCSDNASPQLNGFNHPESLAFDSHGNLFVTDTDNNRIQKFMLMSNSCSK